MWSTVWQTLDAMTTGSLLSIGVVFSLAIFGEMGLPGISPILESLLIFTGFQMAHGGHVTASIPFLAITCAGRLCGATSTYWLSASLGTKIIDRFGRYIRISRRRLDQITQRLGTSAIPMIVVARFTPGLTVASSIACGLSKIRYKKFLASVGIHTLAWETLFLALGILGGKVSESFKPQSQHALLAIWIAIVIAVAASAGYLFLRRPSNRT